jgi:DNA invertase Pin-like site-specific DNA recombinase
MAEKRAFGKDRSTNVFGQSRKPTKMFRAGLYARVSTNDQQTLAMQNRAMREYAARRGWTIAMQVREVNSGAVQRQAREQLMEAARRREIDVVLVWRLDRWGRSVTDLLATLQELEHLGVGFVSLTEALDLTTPAGRAMAGLLAIFAGSNGRFCGSEPEPAWHMRARTGNDWVGRRPRAYILRKSGNCIVPASANPRSPVACRSGAPPSGESWEHAHEKTQA